MARISTYALDTTLSLLDRWIGSDGNNYDLTKNFTAGSIAELYNNTSAIFIAWQATYQYQTQQLGGRRPGTFSLDAFGGDNLAIADVVTLKFSRENTGQQVLENWWSTSTNDVLLLQDIKEPDNFGVFKIESVIQDVDEPLFYDVTLTVLRNNGILVGDQYYKIGIVPIDGVDKHYTHTQNSAATLWTVEHNLNKHPSVSITVSGGRQGHAQVNYIDKNNLTLEFSVAKSGYAYLN